MVSKKIRDLMSFLDESKSLYHVVANLARRLDEGGYTRLSEGAKWELTPGGKYYLIRGGSAILAFRIPKAQPEGFLISASHCDRPTFKVKENGELVDRYTRLATETYGGMIIAPWLDRPLSIAGRVLVETENGAKVKLVDIDRDLLVIPNVAIHMNRKVNEGYAYNTACDTFALLGGKDAAGRIWKELENQAGGKILGHDLFLYVRQKATILGMEEEFIAAPALDDLQCVWGCTEGFLNSKESRSVPVLGVFDSEEVGSTSAQGAASTFLRDTLERLCEAMGWNYRQMLVQSFMISADNAHAVHPNHPEYADPSNAPVVGGGIAVKFNASWRYTTDGISVAVFRRLCARAGVKVQTFCNRSDIPGGTTLGHISLGKVSVPAVDIGLPQLAMHSCYETAGVSDSEDLARAMEVYYCSTLTVTAEGEYCLN